MGKDSQVKNHYRKGRLVRSHKRKNKQYEKVKKNKNLVRLGTTGLAIGGLLGIRHLANKDFEDKIKKIKEALNNDKPPEKGEDIFSKLNKDRNTPASINSKPFIVDDPKEVINKGRITERTKNINRIMKGGVADIYPGLATDLYAIKNKKITGKPKQQLIKQVSQKLKILKAMGKFMFSVNNIEFKRGKDKKKRKSRSLNFLGDKRDKDGKKTLTLREPVLKRGLPGVGIGAIGGAALGNWVSGLGRRKYKEQLLLMRNNFIPYSEAKKMASNPAYELSKKYKGKLPLKFALAGATIGGSLGLASGLSTYNRIKTTLNDVKNYKLPEK